MKWTQELPKISGYYWFAMKSGGQTSCVFVDLSYVLYGVEICIDLSKRIYCVEEDGYFFSSGSVQPLEWT